MTLREVVEELSAEVLHGAEEELNGTVATVAAGDLMSDVLTRATIADLLVTGLSNMQTIRTATVAGIKSIVIVRGKPVSPQMIDLAREEDLVLMVTGMKLFEAAGRLWARGLRTGETRA
ncbi:MAG: hypothetical protein FJY75_05810 [Candidatus Eisenbacteria bacterium]|uniref:DRTGG domain-containing protein n=1 Tax=Eiseniibacteriota bacterium TaxID=2212470 RepID=A0A937XB44_UNCEI|nr:hypothetical protein [Candidatus Eisenbacteria bacterium]